MYVQIRKYVDHSFLRIFNSIGTRFKNLKVKNSISALQLVSLKGPFLYGYSALAFEFSIEVESIYVKMGR